MTVRKLVYIANARLPTEKAHGYQICKMCEAFAQEGVEVILLHPYRRQPAALRGRTVFQYYGLPEVFGVRTLPNVDLIPLRRLLLEVVWEPLSFGSRMVWALYAARVARTYRADVYYTRNAEVAFWCTRLGLATVYEVHTVPKRLRRGLLRQVGRAPSLRLVVVLTSFIKERLVRMGFSEEKVIVLPDGVDLRLFEDLPSQAECRSQLGLPPDRPIIGYIGRFRTMEMEKGIPDLIEAMAHLPRFDEKEPLLVCVGGPMDPVPAYLDLACRIGVPEHRLKFVDRVPNKEVPYWLRACDIAAAPFPSTEHYSFFMSPLKLFEYMAAGVAIVATDLPSLREVLRHGENAWLVEPGSPQALAQGIERLLQDPQLAAVLASRARSDAGKYTWKSRAERILQRIGEEIIPTLR
jgi:glycosyltransferase involved in cell wall biosynthesis